MVGAFILEVEKKTKNKTRQSSPGPLAHRGKNEPKTLKENNWHHLVVCSCLIKFSLILRDDTFIGNETNDAVDDI